MNRKTKRNNKEGSKEVGILRPVNQYKNEKQNKNNNETNNNKQKIHVGSMFES